MSFEEHIREWVATDNIIKKMNEQIREERTKRNTLGETILSYATENSLENSIVQITDGKLKFQNSKSTAPLTYKYVIECLEHCLDENINTCGYNSIAIHETPVGKFVLVFVIVSYRIVLY